jgi:hypothetical protein
MVLAIHSLFFIFLILNNYAQYCWMTLEKKTQLIRLINTEMPTVKKSEPFAPLSPIKNHHQKSLPKIGGFNCHLFYDFRQHRHKSMPFAV